MRSFDHSTGLTREFDSETIVPTGPISLTPTISFTPQQAAEQLTRGGYSWKSALGQPVTVTYAFRDTEPAAMPDDTGGYNRMGAGQISYVLKALQSWSDVAQITFVRVTDAGSAYSNNASILFANYRTGAEGAAAFAFLPRPNATGAANSAGDVWINSSLQTNQTLGTGTAGVDTMVHEIGHALGLEHPGDYDAASGVTITYDANAQYIEDSRQYTVMSYFSVRNTGADYGTYFPAAPQLHDIYAIQRLYGAATTTRLGDTIYGFHSNTDREYMTTASNAEKVVFAAWDNGGNDTFDFSGYSADQTIDLRPNIFSNVGGLVANVVIAAGVVIENAIGGSGADTISGNEFGNVLSGGAGNDTLFGDAGDDTLIGGAGADKLQGGAGTDTASYQDATAAIVVNLSNPSANTGIAAGDTYDSVENLIGSAFADTLTGDGGANTIYGGSGNDMIFGLGGDDRLVGGAGNDRLDGGSGIDSAIYGGLFRSYSVSNGQISNAAVGADTLVSIENLPFVDGRLTFDPDDNAAALYRLYDATLDRLPDNLGFLSWMRQLAAGTTLNQAAAQFVTSPEFLGRYGNLSNQAFVEQLYRFALDREGDTTGIQQWVSRLNSGTTRADVVLAFSESGEHRVLTSPVLNAGIWVQDDQSVSLARLYDATFDRLPDAQGLENWRSALSGGTTLAQAATAFASAQEFQNKYGALSNQAFIEQLYRLSLNREGDAAGVTDWVRYLNSGGSRGSVLLLFSESQEHIVITQPLWARGISYLGNDPLAVAENGSLDGTIGALIAQTAAETTPASLAIAGDMLHGESSGTDSALFDFTLVDFGHDPHNFAGHSSLQVPEMWLVA